MPPEINWDPPKDPEFWRRVAVAAKLPPYQVEWIMLSPDNRLDIIVAHLAREAARQGSVFLSEEKAGERGRLWASAIIRREILRLRWDDPDAKITWILKIVRAYYEAITPEDEETKKYLHPRRRRPHA